MTRFCERCDEEIGAHKPSCFFATRPELWNAFLSSSVPNPTRRAPRTGDHCTYVAPTPLGPAYLPADVRGISADGRITLALFIDNSGGTELFVTVPYSDKGEINTWHYGLPGDTHPFLTEN